MRPSNRGSSAVASAAGIAWRNRVLIRRLAMRELEARYRGSMLGVAWAVIVPLGMVLIYTFVFGSIFKIRLSGSTTAAPNMTVFFLAGLIIHQFFSEVASRAPSLILENKNYVTKVVFPLEILSLVSVTVALVGAGIGLVLLLGLTALTDSMPSPTALLTPLVLLGMIPMLLALSWFCSAIGVFARDLTQLMPVALSVLFFLAPVLYPISSVPPPFNTLVIFNPTTIPIEAMRALIFGSPFPWEGVLIYLIVSLMFCWSGFALFLRLRRAFADVL